MRDTSITKFPNDHETPLVDQSELISSLIPSPVKDKRGKVMLETYNLDVSDVVNPIWANTPGHYGSMDNGGHWTFGTDYDPDKTYEEHAESMIDRIYRGEATEKSIPVYEKYVQEIESSLSSVLHEVPNVRRRRTISDQGDSIDVDRYYERELECWETMTRCGAVKRAVTLGINISGNSGRNEDYFIGLVAQGAALVDALVNKGYAVKLIASGITMYDSSRNMPSRYRKSGMTGTWVGPVWTLVDYGERVDGVSLLPYASPATVRSLIFDMKSCLWPWTRQEQGFGTPKELPKEVIEALDVDFMLTASNGGGAGDLAALVADKVGVLAQKLMGTYEEEDLEV